MNTQNAQAQDKPVRFSYKVPAFPAIVGCCLQYVYFWMVPYWITQFIIYCCKERMLDDGVSPADWAILFCWVISNVFANFLGEKSVRQSICSICSPFWFYIIFQIVSIFFTIYFIILAKTCLFFELITSCITLVIQALLLIGTFISFCIVTKARKIKPI